MSHILNTVKVPGVLGVPGVQEYQEYQKCQEYKEDQEDQESKKNSKIRKISGATYIFLQGVDQEILPCGQGRIESVKINPFLPVMKECLVQVWSVWSHQNRSNIAGTLQQYQSH